MPPYDNIFESDSESNNLPAISPKIVRDNIPNFAKDVKHIQFNTLGDKEFYIALKDKLIEESRELRDAVVGKEHELEELADVLEIIDRLIQIRAKDMGLSVNTMRKRIQLIQKNKRSYKGGFKKNLYMISTAIIQ